LTTAFLPKETYVETLYSTRWSKEQYGFN